MYVLTRDGDLMVFCFQIKSNQIIDHLKSNRIKSFFSRHLSNQIKSNQIFISVDKQLLVTKPAQLCARPNVKAKKNRKSIGSMSCIWDVKVDRNARKLRGERERELGKT